MFDEYIRLITENLLPASAIRMNTPETWATLDGHARENVRRNAEHALSMPLNVLTVSMWLYEPEAFLQARWRRRERLSHLLLGACVLDMRPYLAAIVDTVWAICEESSWANQRGLSTSTECVIDMSACETGALLAWTLALLRPALRAMDAHIPQRIESELVNRILSPFVLREALANARSLGGELARLSRILTIYMLAESDERRRSAGVQKCLNQMDDRQHAMPEDARHPSGIEGWQRDMCALMDAATLVFIATGRTVDLRSSPTLVRSGHYVMATHLGNGYFLNPDGAHLPLLSGEAVFRFGEGAAEDDVRALGACLYAAYPERQETGSITARLFNVLLRITLRHSALIWPVRPSGRLASGQMMTAFGDGFACGIHAGCMTAGHSDAGDIAVLYRGTPVVIDIGATHTGDGHSLPSIGVFDVVRGAGGAVHPEARYEAAYAQMSLELAPAFPPNAEVVHWKRTLILSRAKKCVRQIESFAFSRPKAGVRFRWITPICPEPLSDGYRLGTANLTWEGDLKPAVEPINGGYRITLCVPGELKTGVYEFVFRAVNA